MISQNDVLIQHKMPIIKPTLHPLDRPSKWNNPKEESQFTLSSNEYIPFIISAVILKNYLNLL